MSDRKDSPKQLDILFAGVVRVDSLCSFDKLEECAKAKEEIVHFHLLASSDPHSYASGLLRSIYIHNQETLANVKG